MRLVLVLVLSGKYVRQIQLTMMSPVHWQNHSLDTAITEPRPHVCGRCLCKLISGGRGGSEIPNPLSRNTWEKRSHTWQTPAYLWAGEPRGLQKIYAPTVLRLELITVPTGIFCPHTLHLV